VLAFLFDPDAHESFEQWDSSLPFHRLLEEEDDDTNNVGDEI